MPETRKYTFWSFIQDHQLEIPIIQRDYAQGRISKKDLRINLLTELKKALDGNLDNGEKILKMDFVYGSEDKNILNPLDGQQRLTTLWLLHWYIALKSKHLKEAEKYLKRFTYETRVSSRVFCEALCDSTKFESDITSLYDFIQNQTWFYSNWINDPTIKSMLVMLYGSGEERIDSIEYIFKDSDYNDCWEKLISPECPIVFYYLPLSEFKLTDDLYIKMNARGEHLADYENLKADLIKYIEFQKKSNIKWSFLLDSQNGFPIKFDTQWIDIFWKNKNEESSISEIYFAFLNRFFLAYSISYAVEKDLNFLKDDKDPFYKYFAADEKISYTNIENYKIEKTIDFSFFEALIKVLDNYYDSLKIFNDNTSLDKLFNSNWYEDFNFIPVYDKEKNEETKKIINNSDEIIYKVVGISQQRRVVHYAICKYFEKGSIEDASASTLKQWMRFVWNLVSEEDNQGPSIRSVSAMRSAIALLNKISNPHNVYKELALFDISKIKKESVLETRFIEECIKAKQIFDIKTKQLRSYNGTLIDFQGKTWEEVLLKVESYFVFRGFIPFLYYNESLSIDWNDFDIKWTNIQKYFTIDEMDPKYSKDCILLKTLISYFDKQDYFTDIIYDNTVQTWKNLLFKDKWKPVIHKILTNSVMCNIHNFQSSISDWTILHEQLVKTNLLESLESGHYLIDDGIHKYLHIYYGYHGNDIYLGDSFHDNKLLSQFTENELQPARRLKNTNFYRDKDITFIYKNHFFKWKENKELVICNTKDYNSRMHDSSGKEIAESNVQEILSKNDFIVKLDSLIQRIPK
ncbi:MAG: DUF262 domain-containing protein [Treponema sp.]|nr:DUF262 domain-containing protein [Treponema sp.]